MAELSESAAERIIKLMRDRFTAASTEAARSRLLPVLHAAEVELAARLKRATGSALLYTAAVAAAYRVQVDAVTRALSKHLAEAVADLSTKASGESAHALVTQLRLAEAALGSDPRPALSIAQVARLTGALGRDTSLLQHFLDRGNASAVSYGQQIISGFEDVIAKGLATGASTDAVSDALLTKSPQGLQGAWWRAERIARTEVSYAYNVTAKEGTKQVSEFFPDAMSRWVEHVSDETRQPLDDRVGKDSLRLHGQLRLPGQAFHDIVNKRDVFEPPNRPNDRATLTVWRAAWGPPPGGLAPLDAQSKAAFAKALASMPKPKPHSVARS